MTNSILSALPAVVAPLTGDTNYAVFLVPAAVVAAVLVAALIFLGKKKPPTE